MATRLVEMAEARGFSFVGIPDDAREGILASVDKCLRILELSYEVVFEKVNGNDPKHNTMGWLMLSALSSIALHLIFVNYPEGREQVSRERIQLDEAKTSRLREHLTIICTHREIMAVIDKMTLITAVGYLGDDLSVGAIIRSHASEPALTSQ